MGKTLRLTFAMGGGVSLGSFSGAALTETLKKLVLHGQDANGQLYDRIVVDSMSGASAGAIALAILLRCLVDHESTVDIICDKFQLIENEDKSSFRLERNDTNTKQSKEDFFRIVKGKVESMIDEKEQEDSVTKGRTFEAEQRKLVTDQLIAIEVAQILQEVLWVHEVNMRELIREYPSGDGSTNQENFSLFPRDKISKLTQEYLCKEIDENCINNAKVLYERVLFACSLTNLLPTKLTEEVEDIKLDDYPLVRETQKALNSKSHKELRVFDFKLCKNLGLVNEYVDNWIEIGPTEKGLKFSITGENAWPKIAATAIACGAFPIAFSPVILKRWKKEFPRHSSEKKKETATDTSSTITYNSVWDIPETQSHNFSYVDGGTFNNEPIREAFKLANYIDTNLCNNAVTYVMNNEHADHPDLNPFDRLVVFVDPIVDSKGLTYNMSSYSRIGYTTNERVITKVFTQTNLNRVVPLTARLIGMLRNQGSVKEEHKINDYLSRVRLKNVINNHIENLTIDIDNSDEELFMIIGIMKHLKNALKRDMIPFGTRNICEYLLWSSNMALEKYSKKEKLLIKKKYDFTFSEGIENERNELTKLEKELDDIKPFVDSGQKTNFEQNEEEQSNNEKNKAIQKLYNILSLRHQILNFFPSLKNANRGEQLNDNRDRASAISRDSAQFEELIDRLEKEDDKRKANILSDKMSFGEICDEVFRGDNENLKKLIKRIFLSIAMDVGLDIDGKDPKAVRLAITPVSYKTAPVGESSNVKTIDLPGAEVQAFGGFVSLASRKYAFNYGRYCALKALSRKDFRSYYAGLMLDNQLIDSKLDPFVDPRSTSKDITQVKNVLEGLAKECDKSNQLRADIDLLKKDPIIKPIMERFNKLFPKTRRLLKWIKSVLTVLVVLLIFSALMGVGSLIFTSEPNEIVNYLFIWASTLSSVSILIFAAYLNLKIQKGKKSIKRFLPDAFEFYQNFEVSLLLEVPQTPIRAIRLNKGSKFLRPVPVDYGNGTKKYCGCKVFIRQSEKQDHNGKGYKRDYNLFIFKNSKRSWKINPLDLFKQSSNLGDENEGIITNIFTTSRSWLSRCLWKNHLNDSMISLKSNTKENCLKISEVQFEKLKFFVDPAIIINQDHSIHVDCLAKELESILKTKNRAQKSEGKKSV
ncbi:MAG: patatin-like phospholipase family protein [Bacteroidota bacterium]